MCICFVFFFFNKGPVHPAGCTFAGCICGWEAGGGILLPCNLDTKALPTRSDPFSSCLIASCLFPSASLFKLFFLLGIEGQSHLDHHFFTSPPLSRLHSTDIPILVDQFLSRCAHLARSPAGPIPKLGLRHSLCCCCVEFFTLRAVHRCGFPSRGLLTTMPVIRLAGRE